MNYKPCIISLFDILGFTELVNANDTPDLVLECIATIRNSGRVSAAEREVFGRHFLHFSDTFVRVKPIIFIEPEIEPENGFALEWQKYIGLVVDEIVALSRIQVEAFIRHGILLRGSLTVGRAYQSKNQIFGPAMLRACQIEKEMAVFPRIVVDPIVWSQAKEFMEAKEGHNEQQEIEFLQEEMWFEITEHLVQDEDGKLFVDYLNEILWDYIGDGSECELGPILVSHKERIGELLMEKFKDERAMAKILWLVKYHNSFARQLPNSFFKSIGKHRHELQILHPNAAVYSMHKHPLPEFNFENQEQDVYDDDYIDFIAGDKTDSFQDFDEDWFWDEKDYEDEDNQEEFQPALIRI